MRRGGPVPRLLFGCLAVFSACAAERAESPSPSSPAQTEVLKPTPAAPPEEPSAPGHSVTQQPAGTPESELAARYDGRRALSASQGSATYYGDSFAGRKTASGERYDPAKFTAAHRTLPFGTVIRVVRMDRKAAVYVRVTDRGPFGSKSRIIDLSRAAAERLDMIRTGVVRVRLEVVEYGPGRRRKAHR